MGKKAPFWIYVEELADKMKMEKGRSITFAEVKQSADYEWPRLSEEERNQYRILSKQDRIQPQIIRYEPAPSHLPRPIIDSPPKNSGCDLVLSTPFILVNTSVGLTASKGGEIALAGFSLKEGVIKFLSAHIRPSGTADSGSVKKQLLLPSGQESATVVLSRSEILTEMSQFCNCQQCSNGNMVMFAERSKVEILRNEFRGLLEQGASRISLNVEPIEKLIGAIHLVLNDSGVNLKASSQIADEIIRKCLAYKIVPCSLHGHTDRTCAHGGAFSLAFSFVGAFIEDLKKIGIDVVQDKHYMLKSNAKSIISHDEKAQRNRENAQDATSSDIIVKIPGPVVFIPGRGRVRTTAKVIPWREYKQDFDTHSDDGAQGQDTEL